MPTCQVDFSSLEEARAHFHLIDDAPSGAVQNAYIAKTEEAIAEVTSQRDTAGDVIVSHLSSTNTFTDQSGVSTSVWITCFTYESGKVSCLKNGFQPFPRLPGGQILRPLDQRHPSPLSEEKDSRCHLVDQARIKPLCCSAFVVEDKFVAKKNPV